MSSKRARVFPRGVGKGWKRGRRRVNGEWIIVATDKCHGCREEFAACVCGERVPAPWANTYVMDREAA